MTIGSEISSLGVLPLLSGDVPKTKGEQFEELLAQQFVHAMVKGASQGEGEDHPGGEYLSMMEGVLARELAGSKQLGLAQSMGIGEEP